MLRSKCFKCHRVKLTKEKIKTFKIIFLLVKLGYLIEAKKYKEITENKVLRSYQVRKKLKAKNTSITSSRKTSDSATTV